MRLESEKDGSWETEYKFTLQPRKLQEFEEMCRYHQTSPESHFTRKALCTRATPDGRITLSDMKLITTQGGKKKERVLVSDKERNLVLAEMFGVIPDSACLAVIQARSTFRQSFVERQDLTMRHVNASFHSAYERLQ